MGSRAVVRSICLVFWPALLVPGTGCQNDRDLPRIELTPSQEAAAPGEQEFGETLRVAVGGMITPKEGFAYYRRFLDYLEAKTAIPVEYVDRSDYAEINRLIEAGEVDVGFVCGGPYVVGHKKFGMELLAAPVAYGAPVYYSYIIVPKKSPAVRLEDLRGTRFAFADPLSNSGKLVPTYMLARMGETPESFFKETVFTYGHDKSIKAVAEGLVDGAAVDSLIWEYANKTNPRYTRETRVLIKSPPYGTPPVVARPGLDPEWKKKVRDALLSAHEDPVGREILNGMMIERFIEIDDSAYDSIREMKEWVARTAKEKGSSDK